MTTLLTTAALLLAGACTGLLLGIARVPRIRAVPVTVALTLATALAIAVVMVGPREPWLGAAVAVLIVLFSLLSTAWMWKNKEGVDASYGWILVQEILHPERLRRPHTE
ncbi:hypothetical protein E4V99_15845 [Microbacterium sp. dk485]|uniref:hypothetical protein n=1 Tax=Microbacterium sp. dk485 TaxID=2560021 RepID=UPI0010731A87|nr:hypothetical protein [Microbacterium sp. dk485]TFV82376.1 hypothetical protein E4V99_15845 [Microbacterium sp. dk485]